MVSKYFSGDSVKYYHHEYTIYNKCSRRLYEVGISVSDEGYVLVRVIDRITGEIVEYGLNSAGDEYLLIPVLGWKVELDVENHFKDDYIEFVLDTIAEIFENCVVLEEKHETV